MTGGPYMSKADGFSVDLPEGWVRRNDAPIVMGSMASRDFLMTKDGMLLQTIRIEKLNVDDELRNTKKKFSKGMLPMEAAQVIKDILSSDENFQKFEVVKNVPAKIGGKSGFKAVFKLKTEDGLWLKMVYYGFLEDEWFYGISYTAPQRYYFDRDLKTFETIVKSFKLNGTT